MSHMPMDHLEGLELSEVILHRGVAPAWLPHVALRHALNGLWAAVSVTPAAHQHINGI